MLTTIVSSEGVLILCKCYTTRGANCQDIGANVIGLDVDAEKLEVARQLGFNHLFRFEQNAAFIEDVRKQPMGILSQQFWKQSFSLPATVELDLI